MPTVAELEPAEVGRRLAAGEWVIDVRDRVSFAAEHLHGAAGIALGDSFTAQVLVLVGSRRRAADLLFLTLGD